jgi:hypothetical protein
MEIERREGWLAAAVAVLFAGLMVFPPIPYRVLGSPGLEAENHLFLLWRTAQTTLGEAGPWNNLPSGDRLWIQDWVNLPWFLALPSPIVAWNVTAWFNAWLAALAGWFLAREAGADARAAWIGMASLGTAPFLAGVFSFGLSEAWPIGWWALHAAFLLRSARTGGLVAALFGGVALGAFATSGWYAATFAIVGAPILLGWAWSRGVDRWGAALIVAQGVLAILITLPFLSAFLEHGDVHGLAARSVEPWARHDDWRSISGGGADLLAGFIPPFRHISMSRTTYLGVVAAALGWISPRRTWPMWLGIGVFSLLAMGPWFQVLGAPIGPPIAAPAGWLMRWVPWLCGIGNWYRAAGMSAVLIAPAAALGLTGRSWRWIVPAGCLIVVDAIALGEAPFPRPSYPVDIPATLLAIPGDGPLLLLPFAPAESAAAWDAGQPRHRAWQPLLARPLADNYEGPTDVRAIPWVAWVESRCGNRNPPLFDPPPPSQRPSDEEIRASAGKLRAIVDEVAVVLPQTANPDACVAELERAFGPAERSLGTVAFWRLQER